MENPGPSKWSKTNISTGSKIPGPIIFLLIGSRSRGCGEVGEGQVRRALDKGLTPLPGLHLVFTSPATGRHHHTAPVQQDYIRPAGCCVWWSARSAASGRES